MRRFEVDCGERPSVLDTLPRFRAALAGWMDVFDAAKATPLGTIGVVIVTGRGGVRLGLVLGEAAVTTRWPAWYLRFVEGSPNHEWFAGRVFHRLERMRGTLLERAGIGEGLP